MPQAFPKHGILAVRGGRPPWSARDALVPLFSRRIKPFHNSTGRPGGRPRTRASAPLLMQMRVCGNLVTLTVRERFTETDVLQIGYPPAYIKRRASRIQDRMPMYQEPGVVNSLSMENRPRR